MDINPNPDPNSGTIRRLYAILIKTNVEISDGVDSFFAMSEDEKENTKKIQLHF